MAFNALFNALPATSVEAHCDGPCGVYDPASARIAAEAAYSMTKKILALAVPPTTDAAAFAKYINVVSRYVAIKDKEAQKAKDEILVLYTDFFKPAHLEKFPELQNTFWKAAKTCSYVKQEVSLQHAEELIAFCKEIHVMFWTAKGRADVPFYTALNL